MIHTRSHRWRALAIGLPLLLVAAACGDDDDNASTSSTEAASETTQASDSSSDVEVLELTDDLIAAAEQEGQFFLRYSAQQESMEQIIAVFEETYDVDVTAERKVRAEGTEAFATEERAGQHIVDVHFQTDREGNLALAEEGLYAQYTLANLDDFPDTTYIEPWAYSPYWTDTVLSYSPDNVTTEDAEELFDNTWEGLTDPRFAGGRIGILHPDSGSQAVFWYWALDESPDYGQEFLDAVADQDPIIVEGSARGRELLAAGEIDLFIGDVEGANVLSAVNEGSTTRWIYPDLMPAYAVVLNFISANAPHPNAARLFTVWLHSEEGAEALMQAGLVPTLEGVEDTRPQLAELEATDWWQPYPVENRITVPFDEQDLHYLEYVDEMKQTFNIPSL